MIGQILLEAGQAALVCFVVMLCLSVLYSPAADIEEEEEPDLDLHNNTDTNAKEQVELTTTTELEPISVEERRRCH